MATITKYGETINLSKTFGTMGEQFVEETLVEFGARYVPQWRFDETGKRRYRYDFAVFADDGDVPAFLVEYDGESHYDCDFYEDGGNRRCRTREHLMASMRAAAIKTRLAVQSGIPLLRLDNLHGEDIARDQLLVWVNMFVNGHESACPEADILDWAVGCGEMGPFPLKSGRRPKLLQEAIARHAREGVCFFECDGHCKRGERCERGFFPERDVM